MAANVPGKCGNSTLDSNMISWKWRISLPTKFATKEVFKLATVCAVVSPTTSSAGLPEPYPIMPLANSISRKAKDTSENVL